MRRGLEVAGLPVVELDSGRLVGRVKEALFDFEQGRLWALRVAVRGEEVLLPFEQVYSLGEAAVTVGAETGFARAQAAQAGRGAALGPRPIGKRVLTPEGNVLGFVDDIIFDPDSGTVWGYQVTTGFISDFVEGKRAISLTEELVEGPDSIIVPEAEPAPGLAAGSAAGNPAGPAAGSVPDPAAGESEGGEA